MDKDCESLLFSLSPQQLALLASLIGILLSCDLDSNKQGALGNFFSSIGQTLQTTSAQAELLEGSGNNKNLLDKINNLKQQIYKLEQEIK